ncbi:MAG: amidohydrolase family protein [Polyangiaceae bacterium]|nr:amidohydrolase family protein [Polyangiaceae bacterium]
MAVWIRGGRTFAGDPPRSVAGDLWVGDDGLLGAPPAELPAGTEVLDAGGCLVLPGLVIAHHHLYSALARGMPAPAAPPRSFVEILEKVWWRLDRALDRELVELSGRVGALEALSCGVTGIVDHHASPSFVDGSLDALAAGIEAAGARAVLCYEATNRHGHEAFVAGLAESERFARLHARPTAGASAGRAPARFAAMVGGHAPFTLDDAELAALAAAGRTHGVAVHLHVAEAAHDQKDAEARGARNVTERLRRAGVLEGRAVLAHGVHLGPQEVSALAALGVWVTHQPRSNMNNRVGYIAATDAYGARLALGTDGINGDLWDEAHAAFFRLREARDAGAERVWSWLAGSWRLASEAFGLEPARGFGTLAHGAPGDVVVLDYDGATEVHAGNLPWHLAFGLSARHVRDVVACGRVAVRERRPVGHDVAALRREGAEGARRLWSRMAALG